ncbi:MAG: peptidylprolyl isomerase [Defluviitaleaceae bacterium]|nr:peptidylprolyl isomerase [Defluviitaleaceae bacterium]
MKKIIYIILCLVLVVSLAACNTQPSMGSGSLVLATSESGNLEILLRDYLYFLGNIRADTEEMLHEMGFTSDSFYEEYWSLEMEEGSGRSIFEDVKDVALEQVKWTVALYGLARERGYTYDPDELNMINESVQEAVMFLASPERTGERMFYEMYYITPQEMVEVFRMLLTSDNFQRSVHDSLEITEADLRAFYNDSENFEMIENLRGMTVAHILVTFDDEAEDTAANREEIQVLAEDILARIEAGESFASLVTQYSEDPGSVDDEGQYYISINAPFVPEFMAWAIDAEVGDLGIVETEWGLHIMNLVSRDTFEDMLELRMLPVETLPGHPPAHLPALDAIVRHGLFVAEMEPFVEGLQFDDWVINETLFNSIGYDVYARQGR